MKKLLLTIAILSSLAAASFAQTAGGSFTFTPSTQTVTANSSFTITVGYTGTTPPANIAAYDLYLVTAAANQSLFTITSETAGTPFNIPSGTFPVGGSAFTTTNAASGFVINDTDLGFGGTAQSGPSYNFTNLETLLISTGSLTVGSSYTFFSSTAATSTGGLFSDVTDNLGSAFATPQSAFTINAVPEPSTWLAGFGAAAFIGYSILRRRQTA